MRRVKWIALAGTLLLVLMTSACWFGNVTITILQTSDVHHRASGYGPFLDYTPMDVDGDQVKGGYARLATLINDIRQEQKKKCMPTLLFDSGDFTMGTVYDLTAADPIALKFFQLMKYDAVTLGNHEFDWSPSGLAMLLSNAKASGFTVPVVATNMVVPEGNVLQGLMDAGVIVKTKVLVSPYGVKVGLIGLMGPEADSKAPVAPPVTFNHDYAFIQQQVDYLKKTQKVDVVIALSHSGVENDGTGEDADLATNVTGIDIIASGHYHTATGQPIVTGASNTIIFSPGRYGEYLSRLDVTYNIFTRKLVSWTFKLIPVNDSVPGDPVMQSVVEAYHASIDASIAPLEVTIGGPVSRTDFQLSRGSLRETGIGNLVADSLRATANSVAPINDGNPFDFSVVASGVIRDGFYPGNTGYITFADIYNVLPLGISPDTSQPLPGYPLMSLYVTAADLRNICEAALTVAPVIGGDFYLNFSGLRIYYDRTYAPYYAGVRAVAVHEPDDTFCTGPSTFLNVTNNDPAEVYHCVVDLYALQMMNAVTSMGLRIIPRDESGVPINPAYVMAHRIDASPAPGVQELKEWMALLSFLGAVFPASGPGIDEGLYGDGGAALGRITFLN